MTITAAQVKALREKTSAGVVDCKKALVKAEGNMDAAIEILRKKGLTDHAPREDKTAAEGMCCIARDGDTRAAVVEVNSETDFVAKNEKFRAFVAKIAQQILNTSTDNIETFMDEAFADDPARSVREALAEIRAIFKEKLSIRRFRKMEEKEGCVAAYLHGEGKIGVLVDAETAVVNESVREALRNVAMQIAAMNPVYISQADISEDYREHEKEILLAQAIEENNKLPEKKRKPQNIIEKMISGRLNKQFREICLLDQVYVRAEDGKQTVGQYLEQVGKVNGTTISIKEFVRFKTGEGIDKKQQDFAREVFDQINAAARP